jgi:hypothetical protein
MFLKGDFNEFYHLYSWSCGSRVSDTIVHGAPLRVARV